MNTRRKVFVSHYGGDRFEVDRFIDDFANKMKITPYVLGANDNDDYIDSSNPEYVMTKSVKNICKTPLLQLCFLARALIVADM